MPNPNFMPVVGGGFDQDAAQQFQWAGFNNSVDRANLDSYARAVDQQNNYFRDVAGMNREDAQRAQQRGDSMAEQQAQRYQFGQKQAQDAQDQQAYLALEKAKIAASLTNKSYEEQRGQAIADAQNDFAAVQGLAAKGHFLSRDEIAAALPKTDKVQVDALWSLNEENRKQVEQQYQFSGDLAKQENLKNLFTRETANPPTQNPITSAESGYSWLNPEKYNPLRLLGVGAMARWAGSSAPPDTSWFDALKQRQQALATRLAPYDTGPKGAPTIPAGLILDPTTGRYRNVAPAPGGAPAWIPPAPASQFSSPNDVKAAFKSGQLTRDQAAAILQQQFGMQ